MALTDTRLKNLKPKGRAECLVADGNGLYVRVRVGKGETSRTWQFRRREGDRLTITQLGVYPDLTIKEARLKAAELATKRTHASPTVEVAANQWLRERVDHTHRQADQVRGYIERSIIPVLGQKRVRDVEPSDIARMIRSYRDRVAGTSRARAGGRPAARALLAACKGLFSYAVANGWTPQSPAAQITGAIIGAPPVSRARVLSNDELRLVLTTAVPAGPVLRFLLLTGLRLGEAYKGYREGQHWVIPATASKNRREHRVWLSALALVQLSDHPWAVRREAVQKWLKVNAGGWTAHDLRRTFSTRLNGMGIAPFVVEKMLNHTFGGVMAVYNHATYDTERREALDAWSHSLDALSGDQPADVIWLGRSVQRRRS